MAITKEMIVGDVIDQYPDTAQVLIGSSGHAGKVLSVLARFTEWMRMV